MYLNCKTYFSLRYGTFATKELVETAVNVGVTTLALTNINCTADAWEFVLTCQREGIKPVLGAEIRNGDKLLYILLAANNKGFEWINSFISYHLQNEKPFPEIAEKDPFFTDSWDGYVIYPLKSKDLKELFPNEFIGVQATEISKLYGLDISKYKEKFVIRHPVTFQNEKYYNVHRLLRSIDNNVLLSKLPAESVCATTEYFVSPEKLLQAFKNYSFIVTNTYRLVDACNIQMDFTSSKNKKHFSASVWDDKQLLEKLAFDGLKMRYGNKNKVAIEKVKKELEVINKLNFNTHFLIPWDVVRYAKSRGFYYVGRGSAANSIVSYCLQITDVDPIELDLFFERFLNVQRTSPPDFDMDFSWLDRDEVIDYVFKRYGEKHVALLGTHSTFKDSSITRELGKVFGLPKEEIDVLSDAGFERGYSENRSRHKYERHIYQYGKMMQNFPNIFSIHAGGMLISELPIHHYTATHMPPKGFATAQIDMFTADDIGLYKVDILSQRGLGHIKETIRLVKQNKNIDVNIHEVDKFKNDPLVKSQLRSADTIGCFYVESPAMRGLEKKLRCDDYKTLVVASSIIRPGVSESGMMRQYIHRYHNPHDFQYLHPAMEEHLKETFGVMVFQEDVIKIANAYAGLDYGDGDILRRAMSGKYRSNNSFSLIKDKFYESANKLNRPVTITHEIWRQMESFAGYSFCKAHSASYAVESFQDLFLKAYYPLEFMVAVINNFGGFYPTNLYFYQLIKSGAKLHLPCINRSEFYTTLFGTDVYAGFVHIKDFQEKIAEIILQERQKNGHYSNLQEFIERTNVPIEQLNLLIKVGAFRFIGKDKIELLWEGSFLKQKNQNHLPTTLSLFEEKPVEFKLPEFEKDDLDDIYNEVKILGYPLRNPFELVDDDPSRYSFAKDIQNCKGKDIEILTFFIADKVVPTKNNRTMSFGTFIDANLDWVDTVHFPNVFENEEVKRRNAFYRISGKVVEEFNQYSIEVSSISRVGYKRKIYGGV